MSHLLGVLSMSQDSLRLGIMAPLSDQIAAENRHSSDHSDRHFMHCSQGANTVSA